MVRQVLHLTHQAGVVLSQLWNEMVNNMFREPTQTNIQGMCDEFDMEENATDLD